jgi:hypothetical protein
MAKEITPEIVETYLDKLTEVVGLEKELLLSGIIYTSIADKAIKQGLEVMSFVANLVLSDIEQHQV